MTLADLKKSRKFTEVPYGFSERRASEEPDQILIIYERWVDQEALDFHMGQDYLKDFLSKSVDLLDTPIESVICREITV
jgi:quinol monooxygenase YgiN